MAFLFLELCLDKTLKKSTFDYSIESFSHSTF